MNIVQEAKKIQQEIVSWRRELHKIPEVGLNLPQTSSYVARKLKVVGENKVIELKSPTMGGEDMAYYLEQVQGTYFYLGSGNEAKGITAPHHNSKFDVDEDVFWLGTALLAQAAFDWLEKDL